MEYLKNVKFLYGVIAVFAIALVATNWNSWFGSTVDTSGETCKAKIKDLAIKFGKQNLDTQKASDFYNYLLG